MKEPMKYLQFDLSLLSKYRTQLMGMAAMLIILCHSLGYGIEVNDHVLRQLINQGNLGVDLFLFLSGFGCYYSLSKISSGAEHLNNEERRYWLKKRFIRIAVPYTVCLVFQWILYIIYGTFDWKLELLCYSTLGYWLLHKGAWYVALLVPLYLLTPWIYALMNRFKHRVVGASVMLALLLVLCVIPLDSLSGMAHDIAHNVESAFSRTSSFIVGMAIAPYIKSGKKVNWFLTMVVFAICGVVCYFFPIKLFYGWCLVPVLLLVFTWILQLVEKWNVRIVNVFFLWLGAASLESYLTNTSVRVIAKSIYDIAPECWLFTGHYFDYSLVAVFGLAAAYFLHIASEKVKSLINGK